MNQYIINKVLDQIVSDVEDGDLTAIEEMLKSLPADVAIGYLPEELQLNTGEQNA